MPLLQHTGMSIYANITHAHSITNMPLPQVAIEHCIAHGTRTSVACTWDQRSLWKWKHKYMLNGVHVIVEPWTNPPLVVDAYRVVPEPYSSTPSV